MTTRQTENLERDEAQAVNALRPLVRAGFERIGGPSDDVLAAIRREAFAHCARRRLAGRLAPYLRALSAAAALALVAAAALQAHLARQAGRLDQAVSVLLELGDPQAAAASPSGELANRLLDLQGLDEEAFFKHEGAEALWL